MKKDDKEQVLHAPRPPQAAPGQNLCLPGLKTASSWKIFPAVSKLQGGTTGSSAAQHEVSTPSEGRKAKGSHVLTTAQGFQGSLTCLMHRTPHHILIGEHGQSRILQCQASGSYRSLGRDSRPSLGQVASTTPLSSASSEETCCRLKPGALEIVFLALYILYYSI